MNHLLILFIGFIVFANQAMAVNEVPLPKSVFPPPRSLMPKAAPTPNQSTQDQPIQAVPIQSVGGAVPPTTAMESIFTEDMIRSLRDPFVPPIILSAKKEIPKTELEQFPLKDFHLNGVITGPKKLRAIVTGPSGKTYFVMIGDHIGTRDGKISAIQPDFLKVVEYELDEKGKKIPEIFEVRLNGEMVSLSQKEE